MMDVQLPSSAGSVIEGGGDAPRFDVNEHRIVCVGNAGIFLIAERHRKEKNCINVWKLNFATRQWKQDLLENENTKIASLSRVLTVLRDGNLHCLSFLNENQLLLFRIDASIYLYNIDGDNTDMKNAWEEIECTGDKPLRLEDDVFGLASYFDRREGFLYVVRGEIVERGEMGEMTQYHINTYRLNTENWTWEKLSEGPTWDEPVRYYPEMIVHDGTLYLLCCSGYFLRLDQIIAFSVSSRSWTLVQTFPDPHLGIYPSATSGFSCVLYNDAVYMYGGYNHREFQVVGDLWRLDLITFHWTRISDQLPPRRSHSADVTDHGCLCAFGGWTNDKKSNAVIRVWLDVPPLQEMCWDVLLASLRKNIKNINNLDDETLHSYKIPNQLLKRLRF